VARIKAKAMAFMQRGKELKRQVINDNPVPL
jgi:hypothetical protein